MYPTHVVVDTHDGATFAAGEAGVPFSYEGAREFAEHANAAMKPDHRKFRVFRLVATTETLQAMRDE